MNSPFISIRVLVIGAALLGILIACAIVIGTPESQTISNVPAASPATSTAVSTVPAAQTAAASSTPTTTVSSASSTPITKTSTTSATSAAAELTLSISPADIIEGDPVMITINGGTSSETTIADIKSTVLVAPGPNIAGGSATADLHFMNYQNKAIAFYGTGINQTTGKTTVTVTMKNGAKLAASFTIGKRVSPTESLAVPADLGGNSTSSQEALVANLDAENAELADVYSNPNVTFWNAPFSWPVHAADVTGGIVITDPFGYERDSGAEEIIHKGTDFKAPPGTPVYAINAGYVRVTKLFSVYGNTVIVDHGMGIQSFYMHLSKMVVTVGEPVKQGQLLGYSGETGYSEGPHLHLTIRVGGISIDPMVFLGFFGLKPDSYAD